MPVTLLTVKCHFVIAASRVEPQNSSAKYWEIIADNLKKAGWSLGWVPAVDCEGQIIWILDAHRGDGKRFVFRADEKFDCPPSFGRGKARDGFFVEISNGQAACAVQPKRLRLSELCSRNHSLLA